MRSAIRISFRPFCSERIYPSGANSGASSRVAPSVKWPLTHRKVGPNGPRSSSARITRGWKILSPRARDLQPALPNSFGMFGRHVDEGDVVAGLVQVGANRPPYRTRPDYRNRDISQIFH